MILSLMVYGILINFGYLLPKTEIYNTIPSFWRLLFMKEDEWIKIERGDAALDYIKFQRLFLFLGTILVIVSTILLTINVIYGKSTLSKFEQTTIIAITSQTDYKILLLIALAMSLIIPAMLIPCIFHHARHLNDDMATPGEDSRTVMVFGFDREMDSDDVSKFCEKMYSKCKLVEHTWGYSTYKLHKLLHKLQYIERTIEILEQTNEQKNDHDWISRISRGNKKIEFYKMKEKELKAMIKTEARESMKKCKRLSLIFLTFESNAQARFVVDQENNWMLRKLKKTFCLAPHPDNIIWANLRDRKLSWLYCLIFSLSILIVFSVFATPFAFITQVQQLVMPVLETLHMRFAASIVPTLLYFIFTTLVPVLIKKGTVSIDWSYTQVVPSYMRRVYCWSLSSIVILPLLMLTNTTGMAAFIVRTLSMIFGEDLLPDSSWDCVFLPDSGAFFINFLIISGTLGNQLQLYRVGDRIYEMWLIITSCRSVAEKTAAKRIGDEYNRERTGLNMCLAEDYVTLLLNFSIAITFFVACPLVTHFFLLYLISKHMVDIQNFRLYYTAKFHNDLLITTAKKIAIFSTLLVNINIAALILSVKIDDNYTTVVSGCIAVISIIGVLISCWIFSKKKEKYRMGRNVYDRSYIDPCLTSINNLKSSRENVNMFGLI